MLRLWRALAGLVLLSFGLLMLVDLLGGKADAVVFAERWWPAAIVAVVLAHAATFLGHPFPTYTNRFVPLAVLTGLAVVAGLLLLGTTRRVSANLLPYVGACSLMCAGAVLVVLSPRLDQRYETCISVSAILRRTRRSSRARGIRQVAVQALIGQVALDLTAATLAGDAEVHVSTWVGSVILRLPAGWKIDPLQLAGSDLVPVVQPVPPSLNRVPARTVGIHVLGIHGRLVIEWGEAPRAPSAVTPGTSSPGGAQPSSAASS